MLSLTPETFETLNLLIQEAIPSDTNRLQAICNSWVNKALLEGDNFEPHYIENCIRNGDLPPIKGATKNRYQLKAILKKETSIPIGFFDLYHGYPNERVLWISIFLIHPECQQMGYGKEIIDFIANNAKVNGYAALGLGVHLKNWKGIRFWHKCGFTQITSIKGDREYSETTFSVLGLERKL